jgi:hypothetical protein
MGRRVRAASGKTRRIPLAMAAAASMLLRLPFKESGARMIFIESTAFPS